MEDWKDHFFKGPQGGNIYIKLINGRTVPLFSPSDLNYYQHRMSSEVIQELDRISWQKEKSKYDSFHEKARFYSAQDVEDVRAMNSNMQTEMEARKVREKNYKSIA